MQSFNRPFALVTVTCMMSLMLVFFNSCADTSEELPAAILEGNASRVQDLLDKGADVNAKYSDGATPLMSAILSGNTEIVRILLDKGADVNAVINFMKFKSFTPLMMAAFKGYPIVA